MGKSFPYHSFREWMDEVDRLAMRKWGLGVDSLVGDMLFYDAFDAGQSPTDFIRHDVTDKIREEYGND